MGPHRGDPSWATGPDWGPQVALIISHSTSFPSLLSPHHGNLSSVHPEDRKSATYWPWSLTKGSSSIILQTLGISRVVAGGRAVGGRGGGEGRVRHAERSWGNRGRRRGSMGGREAGNPIAPAPSFLGGLPRTVPKCLCSETMNAPGGSQPWESRDAPPREDTGGTGRS